MDEATDKINTSNWNEADTTATESIASASADDDFDEEADQIRAEIEDTRADMSQTINEIQERLSPEHLMGQVKETVREATIGKVERVMETIGEVTEPAREMAGRAGTAIKEAGSSVGDMMWRNPIPVAMIGLGLGMLLVRNYRGQTNEGRMRQTQQGGGTLDHMKETAGDIATKARNGASTVTTRFEQLMHDNPIAIGAVAVAAGAALGLALPSTRFESEYIGETGERLVDSVEDVARGALDKVQEAVR